MNPFHPNVLTERQREVLAQLGPFADSHGFYLAGGTAVALRLGHRLSEDFDWFAPAPSVLPDNMPSELEVAGIPAVTREISPGTYHGQVGGVNITFLRYRYALLEPPEYWSEYGCRVASLADLGCMKLSAVSQRSEPKDFIDLYVILNQITTLAELLTNYRRKYNVSDIVPVLYGLTYFDEAERKPMPRMLVPLDWPTLKSTLSRQTKEAFQKLHQI